MNDENALTIHGTVPYSIKSVSKTRELVPVRKKLNNMLSGSFWIVIFSVLLWWIPVFGPMISGYTGGRKAGSPIRGFVAAIIPIILFIAVMVSIGASYISPIGNISDFSKSVGLMVYHSANSPTVVKGMASTFSSLNFEPTGFMVITIFSVLGGVMAESSRNESKQSSAKYTINNNLNLFSPTPMETIKDVVSFREFFEDEDKAVNNNINNVNGEEWLIPPAVTPKKNILPENTEAKVENKKDPEMEKAKEMYNSMPNPYQQAQYYPYPGMVPQGMMPPPWWFYYPNFPQMPPQQYTEKKN